VNAEAAVTAGEASGATGMFTVTIVRPAAGRPIAEHWAYDDRGAALAEFGLILERVAPGTELVLRDPVGVDLLRVARTA